MAEGAENKAERMPWDTDKNSFDAVLLNFCLLGGLT